MKLFALTLAASLLSSPAFALDAEKDTLRIFDCARAAGIIGQSEPNACFMLVNEGEGANEGVALREKHSRACGGDPALAPLRAFFSMSLAPEESPLGYEYGGEAWKVCPSSQSK